MAHSDGGGCWVISSLLSSHSSVIVLLLSPLVSLAHPPCCHPALVLVLLVLSTGSAGCGHLLPCLLVLIFWFSLSVAPMVHPESSCLQQWVWVLGPLSLASFHHSIFMPLWCHGPCHPIIAGPCHLHLGKCMGFTCGFPMLLFPNSFNEFCMKK